jgi:hypothetical protein
VKRHDLHSEHEQIVLDAEWMRTQAGRLPALSLAERQTLVDETLERLRAIGRHTAAEERVFYPILARLLGTARIGDALAAVLLETRAVATVVSHHLDSSRELAPSSGLRTWFGHDPEKFEEFRRRYRDELAAHDEKLHELRRRARGGTVTLVYAARDTEHNDAVVLAELLRRAPPVKRPRGAP